MTEPPTDLDRIAELQRQVTTLQGDNEVLRLQLAAHLTTLESRRIEALAAQVTTLTAALRHQEWQPIETAPLGVDVLVFSPDAVEWAKVCIAHRLDCEEDGLLWYGQDTDNQSAPFDVEPTRWMLLPDLPGEA